MTLEELMSLPGAEAAAVRAARLLPAVEVRSTDRTAPYRYAAAALLRTLAALPRSAEWIANVLHALAEANDETAAEIVAALVVLTADQERGRAWDDVGQLLAQLKPQGPG